MEIVYSFIDKFTLINYNYFKITIGIFVYLKHRICRVKISLKVNKALLPFSDSIIFKIVMKIFVLITLLCIHIF